MIVRIALFSLLLYYEGINSQSVTAACNDSVTIDCGSKLIAISLATFDDGVPSQLSVTPPSSVIDVVRTACQYKSYCMIYAADVTFGTPCSGEMLLNVSYTCVAGLQGDLHPSLLGATKSSVQIEWQNHSQEDNQTKYVIERRYVPASQPSAVAGLSFDGFGYIEFSSDSFKGGTNFRTTLSFRTYAPSGLLFFAFKSDWTSYTYLQLQNGTLQFAAAAAKQKSVPICVSATVALNDGQFHRVIAENSNTRGDTLLKLTVDGTSYKTPAKGGGGIDVSVDSVYVGGVPSTQHVDRGVLDQVDGFVGCMNVKQLDDNMLDLLKNESYENVRWSSNGCPPAVQNGLHFRGTGYAKLAPLPSSNRLDISFRMRSSWPNGLILAAYSNNGSDFLFVELRIDGLDLRYRNGLSDGPFLVPVRPKGISLCDGAWHAVSLSIGAEYLTTTVDGVALNTSSRITKVQTFSSEIMTNFYLGGIEQEGESSTMEEIALGYGVKVTSYGGCLADFKVNGQTVDFLNSSFGVSFAGCPDFTWAGPTCIDQLLNVGSVGAGSDTLTDTSGLKPFTEYLYRLTVESGSGALVHSDWIVVRTGEDASSKGPVPELEYDGSTGKGTLRWTGPPAIVNDYKSYSIKFASVYPGTTVEPSALTFESIENVSLPYSSDVAALTMYVFTIAATVGNDSVTSNYANVSTGGRECRRFLYHGAYYRGTTSVSADVQSCLNWSELSTYSNLVELYPEVGLGNHSYCRNPINRAMPWCYTNDTSECLGWSYCDIDLCEDVNCYSAVDNGYGYRGSSTDEKCAAWNQFMTFPVSQYAEAGLGSHNYCRNPDPETRSKPWCYRSADEIVNCSVSTCISDFPSVTYVCGVKSDTGQSECIFPFSYNGKTFFECTSFDQGIPWCSTKNYANGTMEEWSYCLCPKPSNFSSQPPLSSPPSGERNGTCPSSLTPSATLTFGTVAATIVSSTTASASAAGTMFRATSSAVLPYTTEASPINLKSAAATIVSPTTTFFTGTPVSSNTAMVVATTTASNAASSATVPSGTVVPTRLKSTPINQSSLPTFDVSPALQSRFSDSTGQAASQSTSSLFPTPSVTSSPSNQIPTTSVTPMPGRKTDRSGLYVGVGVGVGVLVLAIAVVVVVFAFRGKRKSGGYNLKDQAMELSTMPSPIYAVVSPDDDKNYPSDEYRDSSAFQRLSKPSIDYYEPVDSKAKTAKTAQIFQNPSIQDDGQYEVPVSVAQSQAISQDKPINEEKESVYWEPAKTEEKLYDQLNAAKFRVLERSSIQLEEVLGTGQFGTVEKGIWTTKDSKSPVVVAVKTLKSESKENKVKFLQEAAIMGQFSHRNVLVMYGVVLTGKPLMVVLEILPKGDLKQYLQSIASENTLPLDLPAQFLQMARDIAAGMEYLAKRCFVHRDLAARNVLLDEKIVCKIADFGLSRDLSDGSYYVTKGGQIPIRWTAPEAISFRKYSTSSDVWSYGIVLYEIWTVGKRPYGQKKNNAVIDLLETGYRLPPPPGCSYAIYELMIECWNPDHHRRPTFNAIATRLSQPDDALLVTKENSESVMGSVGDALEVSQLAYEGLQSAYKA